jgi:hypothetical protein
MLKGIQIYFGSTRPSGWLAVSINMEKLNLCKIAFHARPQGRMIRPSKSDKKVLFFFAFFASDVKVKCNLVKR